MDRAIFIAGMMAIGITPQGIRVIADCRDTISLMPIDHVVALLIAERDKLNAAIEALQGPRKKPVVADSASAGGGGGKAVASAPKKRKVSTAARKRMAEGQKKRWAAIKAAK